MTSGEPPIRVLLVECDELDREGLKCLLRDQPGIDVVAEASGARQAVVVANEDPPDVMLVNSDALPPADELADWLATLPRDTRLLLLCREDETDRIDLLIDHGLCGVVFRQHRPDVVTKAITKVHAGERWIAPQSAAQLRNNRTQDAAEPALGPRQRLALLSDREREIANLVAKGCKNKKIAELLAIREPTVRNHLTSIFRKLQVADRLELALFAHRHGLRRAPRH